jgi:hypothetical protein
MDVLKKVEKRDPAELIPASLPEPIQYKSHREFVRQVLTQEVDLRAKGKQFVDKEEEGAESQNYRDQMNSQGSPSESIAAEYKWKPGTEIADEMPKMPKKVA